MNQSGFSASIWTLPSPSQVTREGVRARARELARIAGRAPSEVAQRDYEQAKREVTGEADPERQEAMLEATDTGN
ncbi:MAG: hypothetical protein JNL92_00555 [Opitutaceae bacterium]|nr:hypothetical protein [Opitutaceae bacterium]